ncbi:uncharacterized protein [Neodiprion pinetum]|uniref:uncharacterized protein n=1 Tax=Neodiprion pinetum TaxID=441929 RepID=UPI0037167108
MEKIIRIQKPVVFDESIAHSEIHAHLPFASSTFQNSDEIHIDVQHQDLCLLPSKSAPHIHAKITKDDGVAEVRVTKLVNMAVCHLFEEVRYEVNGVEIDRNKNVGITSAIKSYVSLSPGQQYSLKNTVWLTRDNELTDAAGNFDVVLPLNYVLGFAEVYCQVAVNAKHELIFTRSNTDLNAVIKASITENFKTTLNKIEWLLPYIKLADKPKIQLLNYIAKDPAISMSFRSWETYVYPMLLSTTQYTYMVSQDIDVA